MRGSGVSKFGADVVAEFCRNNNLDVIIRGHECVMDGFTHFASGRLITVFSATNYCGTSSNSTLSYCGVVFLFFFLGWKYL